MVALLNKLAVHRWASVFSEFSALPNRGQRSWVGGISCVGALLFVDPRAG